MKVPCSCFKVSFKLTSVFILLIFYFQTFEVAYCNWWEIFWLFLYYTDFSLGQSEAVDVPSTINHMFIWITVSSSGFTHLLWFLLRLLLLFSFYICNTFWECKKLFCWHFIPTSSPVFFIFYFLFFFDETGEFLHKLEFYYVDVFSLSVHYPLVVKTSPTPTSKTSPTCLFFLTCFTESAVCNFKFQSSLALGNKSHC